MYIIILNFLSLLLIFYLNSNRIKISQYTKLIDKPDLIRKFHSKDTPLLGGIMIFSIFILLNIYILLTENFTKTDLIIFLTCALFFIVGLIDDLKNLNYKYKFLTLTIILSLSLSIEPNLQIKEIYSSTLHKSFYLKEFSIPFTILCLLLLTNALNLIDGIDGLCILISIIIISWIIITFQNIQFYHITIIISLFYIMLLNLKKKLFLGDSGSIFLSCLIGFYLIKGYNFEIITVNFSIENIFIVLMLPGLDMLRVFVIRIFDKKNPFKPDRKHLNLLLIQLKFNTKKILLIFSTLILIPLIFDILTNIDSIYIIFSYFIFYVVLIYSLEIKSIKR